MVKITLTGHQARYAAIARESAIVSAQHLSRFEEARRLATLVVFAREMETVLTDAVNEIIRRRTFSLVMCRKKSVSKQERRGNTT